MEKNYGNTVITLGIMACILFFIAGIKLGVSGFELVGIRSVSGTSIAEAYYQEMGRFGQAYSLISFAFGLLSLGLSLGIGNYLKLKGKSNISFQGPANDQTGRGIQGKTEIIDSPVNKEDFDGISLTAQEEKSSLEETNLSKDFPKQKRLSGIGLIALFLGVILIIAGRSGIEKEFNHTLEERVAFEKKVLDKVNARMFEVGASPIYKSDLEIEEDAIADQLKGIRINQIIIGLGVILIIIGAVFLILWLKRNRTKNRVKI